MVNDIQSDFYTNNNSFVKSMQNSIAKGVNYQKQLWSDPIAYNFYQKMHYDEFDNLSIFVGKRGKGKSRSAISFLSMTDIDNSGRPRFFVYCNEKGEPHPLSRVVWKIKDFIYLTTVANPVLPIGSGVCWDEAGIEGSNIDWHNKRSLICRHILNVYRYRRLNLVLTFPHMKNVFIGARELLDYIFEVRGRTKECAYVKPFTIYHDMEGKQYRYKMTVYSPEVEAPVIVNTYQIPPPPDYLEKYYSKSKDFMARQWFNLFDDELKSMSEYIKENKIIMDGDTGQVSGKDLRVTGDKVTLTNIMAWIDEKKATFNYKNKIDYDLILEAIDKQGINVEKSILKSAVSILNKKSKIAELNSVL